MLYNANKVYGIRDINAVKSLKAHYTSAVLVADNDPLLRWTPYMRTLDPGTKVIRKDERYLRWKTCIHTSDPTSTQTTL